tara:strand:+ start:150 stop:746 length:597 start_codon:yes stop_codon:yes gene_type:complete
MVTIDNNTLTLSWKGPFTIKDTELFNESDPGLYLFTVKKNSYYSLQYIGMTTGALSHRIVGTDSRPGHLREAISGRYYLYDPEKLSDLSLESRYHLADNFQAFFRDLEENLDLARRNLELQSFFLCPFSEFTDYIPQAERLLIYHALNHSGSESDFPIIENGRGASRPELPQDFALHCKFPDGIEVKGLMQPITAPQS